MQKNITIYDVAKEAGVSPATVSRVMNHYSQVKRETSEKVIAVMRKLEFQRNESKSSSQLLSSADSRMIPAGQPRIFVLSVPHTSFSFHSELAEGAQTAAQKNGHHLLVNSTPVNQYNSDFFIAAMKSHHIAGFLTTESIDSSALLRINDHFPLIQCREYNTSVDQLSYVSIDDIRMTHFAADLLKRNGAERILYITSPEERQTLFRQKQGFQQFFAVNGDDFDPNLLCTLPASDTSYAAGQMSEMLEKLMPDAVLTATDVQASFVLRAAHTLGISIPLKLQVLSLEDGPFAAYSIPAVSVIRSPYYEIGFRAFEQLLSEYLDPYAPKQHILLKPEYICRETTRQTREEIRP